MRFISFAQEFEDLILYVVLKDYVSNGNYVDVGANDPVHFSVTKIFYDMGWSGINIEPLDEKCELLMRERPRDINLCIGIGETDGELRMAVADMGSSFAADVQEQLNLPEQYYTTKKVVPLQKVIDTYGQRETHFLKVDVEGFEKQVLLGADFTKFRPWIIVMESTIPNTDIPCYEKWEYILLENGYTMAFDYGINRYYIANEKSFLIKKFKDVLHFIKNNTCIAVHLEDISLN